MRTIDLAWLAGLMDGEGNFSLRTMMYKGTRYPGIGMHLVMTDKEPVERAASLVGKPVYAYRIKSGKTAYRLNAYGDLAASWMMVLYSMLSPRRQGKIRECLSVWKGRPGRCGPRSKIKVAA